MKSWVLCPEMPVVMPEEQQVITDFGGLALLGESRIGKAQRSLISKCPLLILCLCMSAAADFSLVYGMAHGVNVCDKIPTDFNVM